MSEASSEQRRLIQALRDPRCYAHAVGDVEIFETHISTVLLAGELAYKIKKPVNPGFLDFTRLSDRRHYCAEEVRVNARLAPGLYVGVVPITRSNGRVRVDGGGEPVEFAVCMHRFPQDALLGHLAARGPLPRSLIDQVAAVLAGFHTDAPIAAPEHGFGAPEQVYRRALENFQALDGIDLDATARQHRDAAEQWLHAMRAQLTPELGRRVSAGHIRECHGDLHLDNVLWWRGEVLAFDAIEFAADLRWIDTANDLAFLLMDLENHGQPAAARRLLSAYLERTGDYRALGVMAFYAGYRALVRAKIEALRQRTADQPPRRDTPGQPLSRYLALAARYCQSRSPSIIITCGLSGAGKSTVAAALVERSGYVQLRSDVERKRLFGLSRGARTSSAVAQGLYSADANERTYRRLHDLAREVAAAGYTPVVDASFLRAAERERFRRLARSMGLDFRIAAVGAEETVLRQRLRERAARSDDPSEADERVLDHQLRTREPLTDAEQAEVMPVGGA